MVAYGSLHEDMVRVGVYLDGVVGEPSALTDAYWIAALVTYARCFGTGRRKAYADKVAVPARFKGTHRWLKMQRSTHLAHHDRNNQAEQGRVIAHLDTDARRVDSVTYFAVSVSHPTDLTQGGILPLVRYMTAAFEARSHRAIDVVLADLATANMDRLHETAAKGGWVKSRKAYDDPPDEPTP